MHTQEPFSETPTTEGWIPLASFHLFPWLLGAVGFVRVLVFAFLIPHSYRVPMVLSWAFTLFDWALAGAALMTAFQGRADLRATARLLAVGAFAGGVALTLAGPFAYSLGLNFYAVSSVLHGVIQLLALAAVITLTLKDDAEAGGPIDAAILTVALASSSPWLAMPVLAIAATYRHPLMAALWQALRSPSTALKGGWFDRLDDGLRLRNLGGAALALALIFVALIGSALLRSARFATVRPMGSMMAWTIAEVVAAAVAALVLAVHVLRDGRRSGQREGRGAAIGAMLISALPLLLLLVAGVIVILIVTDVIPFHL